MQGWEPVEPGSYDVRVRCWRVNHEDLGVTNPVIVNSTNLSAIAVAR